MKRYSPSEKISDRYLALERRTLETPIYSLFKNPFEKELRSLEKIEDRYEQLKACVCLEDKIRAYGARDELPKETALEFLKVAKLAAHDEEAFERYLKEQNKDMILFFECVQVFFRHFEKNPTEWRKYNPYASKEPSKETVLEILQIRDEFLAKYPQWVKYTVRIEASKLSLKDKFMKHRPVGYQQTVLKGELQNVIRNGIKDFYRFRVDPSLSSGKICFEAGRMPAVGKSYNWWFENAKAFYPQRKSRLGTRSEYIAFLGVLIKALVDEGWRIADAWYAVCDNSKDLGHYRNSENATHYCLEHTGLREICGFCDLANTRKIFANDEGASRFCLASGSYNCSSYVHPLAELLYYDFDHRNLEYCVGWPVLE